MKILVTGSNGFLAQNLLSKFKLLDYDVDFVNRQKLDLIDTAKVDCFFENNYFDYIFHCAISGGRRTEPDTLESFYQNLKMYLNISKNNKSFGKLVNFGSGAEFDKRFDVNGKQSIYENIPSDFYGLSKNIISRLSADDNKVYNLRIYNVFDHNEAEGRFISSNISNYINKKNIIIHKDLYMDFFYFEDLFSIVQDLLKNKVSQKNFDCVYDKKYKLSEIAKIINNLSDYKVNIEIKNIEKGKDYFGECTYNNGRFVGLEFALKNIYEKLK